MVEINPPFLTADDADAIQKHSQSTKGPVSKKLEELPWLDLIDRAEPKSKSPKDAGPQNGNR